MIKKYMKRLMALMRWSKRIVCEVSAEMSHIDYHDYTDTVDKIPDHFSLMICERCGKEFYI